VSAGRCNPPTEGEGAEVPAPSFLTVDPALHGLRADAFLARALPFLSRTRIRQKVQMGESLLNGRRYATSARLSAGDVLTVFWKGAPSLGPYRQFEVLYQDEHLVAVNKPAGTASHPVGRFQSDTVIQFVRQQFSAEVSADLVGAGDFFPRLVNRLDVFTSGVVLVAKTGGALRRMQDMAAHGKIDKSYVALVEGLFEQDECRIDLPLGPDPSSKTALRMAPRADGLASVTDCVVLRRLREHTLLAVYPRTGRQHQVRAHLAAIGHAIYGDILYKDESLFLSYQEAVRIGGAGSSVPARHCLHAEESAFVHPFTGRRVVIRSPMPSDFREILGSLERGQVHPAHLS
jgi:RluA family pseudouridine synthase